MSEEEHIMKENLVNEDVDKGIELSILFRMALTYCIPKTPTPYREVGGSIRAFRGVRPNVAPTCMHKNIRIPIPNHEIEFASSRIDSSSDET
jgi:hypothetical protein